VNLTELGATLGAFFDIPRAPSHSQLDHAVAHHHLAHIDPARGGRTSTGENLGKTKRIRQILASPAAHTGGLPFARDIVALLRADGAFNTGSPSYAGTWKVTQLTQAFAALGVNLYTDGLLRDTVIDNLSGTRLTTALRSHVNRINLNPDDAPLQVGAGKELDEATARHVVTELRGDYSTSANFPVTLAAAFDALNLAMPTQAPALDPDPKRAVQQCLFMLATAINRLRNDAGTGHGRPGNPRKTASLSRADARLTARATALIAGALLDELEGDNRQ
jgi:hypothetical protein